MSSVKLEYVGYLDYPSVASGTVTTGWYPGNVGNFDTDGKMQIYDGTGDPMFIIVDDDDELASPPTGDRVTVMYGQGKIVVQPDDSSDWSNVYIGPLADWDYNDPIYVTSAGLLTPHSGTEGVSSGATQVGKVIDPPTSSNDYELTMLVTL